MKRLRIEGCRYIGQGVFEGLDIREALATLAQIRDIGEPPQAPIRNPEIPAFLRKERVEMRVEMQDVTVSMPTLNIASTPIRQDDAGRFCLNDLHKAAGGDNRHRPKYWLENQQTQELIEQLREEMTEGGNPPSTQNQQVIEPVSVFKGGSGLQGTYVCKELVYAYAMWRKLQRGDQVMDCSAEEQTRAGALSQELARRFQVFVSVSAGFSGKE
jgi:hypothetical protein